MHREALKLLDDKIELSLTYQMIGDAYLRQNNYDEALNNYKKAEEEGYDDILRRAECLLKSGIIFEKKLQYKEALNNYEQSLKLYALEKQPDQVLVHAYIGKLQLKLGNKEAGKPHLEQAVQMYDSLYLD